MACAAATGSIRISRCMCLEEAEEKGRSHQVRREAKDVRDVQTHRRETVGVKRKWLRSSMLLCTKSSLPLQAE